MFKDTSKGNAQRNLEVIITLLGASIEFSVIDLGARKRILKSETEIDKEGIEVDKLK